MLETIFGSFSTWITAMGGVLVVVIGAFLAGRRNEKKKQKIRGLKNRIKREEIEDDVNEMDADSRSNELRKWMRDT